MRNLKKIKLTNKLKSLAPRLKWMIFSEMQDYKLASDYIDFLCPDPKKESNPTAQLDAIVRASLIKEFSPEIQNTKSFEFLVDAVTHNLKRKALKD